MKRVLPGGFELDDDPDRVDVDAVHDFVSNHSYWAPGRPREEQERLVREASRVVGVYDGDRQIGFARAVSDGASVTYLADVYVLPEYRRRGLGVELVREMVAGAPSPPLTEFSSKRSGTWVIVGRPAYASRTVATRPLSAPRPRRAPGDDRRARRAHGAGTRGR